MNHAENITYGASPEIIKRANELRKRMTLSEIRLWNKLRNRQCGGYKFRRQHPIERFIVDFYCHEVRVVVEVDGPVHLSKEHTEYDDNRSAELEKWEIEIIRFTNEQVNENLEAVIGEIKQVCDKRVKML
ncbi:endonuclease domain-containing protein [Roseimarinus sediminis]|uniref:endonuclease domain-containing protein n=1 Tax=Roseimarinus sediminis TaxID=1610899 RepID=UPI003D21BA7C